MDVEHNRPTHTGVWYKLFVGIAAIALAPLALVLIVVLLILGQLSDAD